MPSLSFDPVAHIYDATRGYPEQVAQQIAQAIDTAAYANLNTRFLELGIGTGRIAFPIATLGRNYTGVDISERMVERLEAKLRNSNWREEISPWGTLPDEVGTQHHTVRRFTLSERQASMRLVMADITTLPFKSATFDVVVAVHVLHLVENWQQAVEEVLRVLRPGGVFLQCWDGGGSSDVQNINSEWQKILQELGVHNKRPGASSHQQVDEFLQQRGLQVEEIHALTWESTITPRIVLENIVQRHWSSTWVISDTIFPIATDRLLRWANDYYGAGIDTVRKQERRFMINRTQV
jgi:ubiquinone/menaquinone biosynthesis C-methylase UbiE